MPTVPPPYPRGTGHNLHIDADLHAAKRRLENVRLEVAQLGLNTVGVEMDILAQVVELRGRMGRLCEQGR